jgi:NAD(P)-dependent dehydrogenase (short-subunit alcohol dehydrogenase family)
VDVSDFDFAGAVAVVTGGASGIGRAMGTRLAAEGSRIAVVDLRPGAAEEVAAELPEAIGLTADVGDPAAVRAMIARVEAELSLPEAHEYERRKVDDRDRWLAGMRRLRDRISGSVG